MKKVNLERGQEIQQLMYTIEHNLTAWKDKENNPHARDLFWHGTGISDKACDQMRDIAIKTLTNKRRSLQREFNKL